jgi:hypothetical protein
MKGKTKGLSAVVLALNHKNKGNGTTTTDLLLLERELKYDCEDCCSVAKTSLELMRSREGGEADSDTGGSRVSHFSVFAYPGSGAFLTPG